MCGICGFFTSKNITEKHLIQMNNTMVHRGPNDGGVYIDDNNKNKIGLAQRRLSVLDLSIHGHQPMFNENKQLSIVFNGEIYNYKEIKKILLESGFEFRTSCDTEVLLKAYAHWGEDCVSFLNGMFAFVIYDRQKNILFGARDRFGKKPFYYFYNKKEFVFASELKPIIKYPYFEKKIDKNRLSEYLYHGYINAPNSIFENVYKLPPGNYFVLKDGVIKITKYWNIEEEYFDNQEKEIDGYSSAKILLTKTLENAVKKRLNADVPVGAFLSGGIDSTLITALAQKNMKKPLKTYSIGFKDKCNDEAVFSKEIAKYLNTEHHELYIDEKMMLELVESIPDFFDEPFGDSSQIPTMLVSQLACKDITVALTGDGGDELFCGYNVYDRVARAKKLDAIGNHLDKHLKNKKIMDFFPNKVKRVIQNRDENLKAQFPNVLVESMINKILIRENKRPYFEENKDINNWQIRRMILDIETYLPGDILTKVDRASMKYSLETRCPLLDYEVACLSFRIPHKYKYYKNEKKYILKDIVYDYVPKQLLNRPKVGFSVPLKKWLTQSKLADSLKSVSDEEFIKKQGVFDYINLNEFLMYLNGKQGYLLVNLIWNFFVFQNWYKKYIV